MTQSSLLTSTTPSNVLISKAAYVGMRISRVELRNFGTYDGPATNFDFSCDGAVIAGGNGMGKSTAFDAMKVAFVTNPELNNAAGSKGERSVTSYYQGAYGSEENTEGEAEEACLRSLGNPDKTMGILVEFKNALGRVFTAVRLLFIDRNGVRTWRYITGNRELSLDEDFPRIDGEKTMRDRGPANGWSLAGNYKTFMKDVADGLGMESAEQAIRAFQLQAIATGLPTMNSTTDFARDYILPPDNFLVGVAKAVESINTHREIRDKIANSKQQLEALDGICKSFDKLEDQFASRAEMQRAEKQFDIVRAYAKLTQSRQRRKFDVAALLEAEAENAQIQALRTDAQARLKELSQKIDAADGGRLDALEQERDTALTQANARKNAQQAILQACAGVRFEKTYRATPESWAALDRAIPQRMQDLASRQDAVEAAFETALVEKASADGQVTKIEAEIARVKKDRSALDRRLREGRAELASIIGVDVDTIPFMAELIQVDETYRADWDLAANRLLGGLAKKVLVPQAHFKAAKGALTKIKAETRIQLEEVRDIDVCSDADAHTRQKLDALPGDILAARLTIKDEHALAPFVRAEILSKADHLCVSNEDFGRTSAKRAICPRGAHSSSERRAEIDNRRTELVLGWSVERQLEALAKDLEDARASAGKAIEALQQAKGARGSLQQALESLRYLKSIMKPWDEVDTGLLDARIARITADLSNLQTAEMEELRAEKKGVEARIGELYKDAEEVLRRLGDKRGQVDRDDESIRDGRAALAEAKGQVPQPMTVGEYTHIRTRLIACAETTGGLAGSSIVLFEKIFPTGGRDVAKTFETLRNGNTRDVTNLTKQISSQGKTLEGKIEAYFASYGDERGLPTSVREDSVDGRKARREWRDRQDQIKTQDLPAAEAAAADFRKTALHTQVLTLRNKLTTYDDQAYKISDGINKIMAGNVFNPAIGSFAKIKIRKSSNPYHRELVARLDDVVNGFTELSDAEVFERVTKIADFLADDATGDSQKIQRKRREEIAQLSNRFEAEVHEYCILEDGSEKLRRRITGSGKLSGGEKDRLSNFLLAAAMKSAFGGHDDSAIDDTLNAILIDEAFGRSTDENASAQISVLQSFNLQVIAATPMSKIRPFQPAIGSVFIVGRPTDRQTAVAHLGVEEIDLSAYDEVDEVPDFGGEAA